MDNYPQLIHDMSEAYINCVRDLETKIRELKSENDDLRIIIAELQETTDTVYTTTKGGSTHDHK